MMWESHAEGETDRPSMYGVSLTDISSSNATILFSRLSQCLQDRVTTAALRAHGTMQIILVQEDVQQA